ncbi:MAG: acyl-CoA desaturase, partial [Solirubrobacterales bacterium]|nr:acyl-CoA desaturase [Solirubrobacterales bacterium]
DYAVRAEIEESRGDSDAAYINRLIRIQRYLAVAGRITLLVGTQGRRTRVPAAVAGATLLGLHKILENMEIGHNVMHGQWDWMNDPDINSQTWDWDTASPASAWRHSHNYVHHTFTNIRGKDKDLGYEIMRIDPHQDWHPVYLLQPFYNVVLMLFFEWGVALHDLDFEAIRKGEKPMRQVRDELREIATKGVRQALKDYVLFPALSGREWRKTLYANFTANLVRNVWSNAIIFCGHFPDQTYTFTEEEAENESRGGWYVRQLTGAANIEGGPLFHLMSGNLGYQVEHHLYPDMPSSRYGQIAPKVRAICEKWGLPYNTGPFRRQWGTVQRTILRLAFPGGRERPKPGPWREPPPEPEPSRNGEVDRRTAEGALAPFP